MMDRAERTGLGFAVVFHAALFAALSLNLLKPPALPKLETTPIEVTLSDEVAPVSTAPAISSAPVPQTPEPVIAPVAPPPAPAPTPMARPVPQPLPRPAKPVVQPKPTAKPVAKPAARPSAARPAPRPAPPQRRPGLSRDLVEGLRDTPGRATPSRPAAGAPAALTAAQKSSINSMIYSQLKRHWQPPPGADAELLVTRLSVRLNKDGSLAEAPEVVGQDGITDSNRPQAKLHAERAIQAVRRAAPFRLPPEYYEAWKWLKPLKMYVGQPG